MMIFRALVDYKWLTAKEVAQHLRVSEKTVYRWAKSGELPHVMWGRTVRFVESEVEAFMLAQKGGGSNGVSGSQ